jgi:hypothetical protein
VQREAEVPFRTGDQFASILVTRGDRAHDAAVEPGIGYIFARLIDVLSRMTLGW